MMLGRIFGSSKRSPSVEQPDAVIIDQAIASFLNQHYDGSVEAEAVETHMRAFLDVVSKFNAYVTEDSGRYVFKLGASIPEKDLALTMYDLLNYAVNEDLPRYENRSTSIVWNSLFDDALQVNLRRDVAKLVGGLEGATLRIADLGAGNGDIVRHLLSTAEESKKSMSIHLVDRASMFINFLNRKITQNVNRRIDELGKNGVSFDFQFYNYDFLKEFDEIPEFAQKFDLFLLTSVSSHLTDQELVDLGKVLKELLRENGAIIITDHANESIWRSFIQAFALGGDVRGTEIPSVRVRRVLQKLFSSIQPAGSSLILRP